MEIRRIRREECEKTRPLWELIFAEDSKEFLDYYYTVKTAENEIYVAEEAGDIRAMLHLNPYRLQVGTKEAAGNYIVAVATKEQFRHQGLMSRLLERSMEDMYERKEPFTFLMPAAEAIYRPFDFRYIYRQQQGVATGKKGNFEVQVEEAGEDAFSELAAFANGWLQGRCDVYTKRDRAYYETAQREQQSERGGILLARDKGRIVGSCFYAKEERFEVREPMLETGQESLFSDMLFALTKNEEEEVTCLAWGAEEKPMIMARIVHLESLLCRMCAEEPFTLYLSIIDPILPGNHGTFLLHGTKEGIRMERTRKDADGEISIGALTSFLFGYHTLEELEKEEEITFTERLKQEFCKIPVFKHIFLNEIV